MLDLAFTEGPVSPGLQSSEKHLFEQRDREAEQRNTEELSGPQEEDEEGRQAEEPREVVGDVRWRGELGSGSLALPSSFLESKVWVAQTGPVSSARSLCPDTSRCEPSFLVDVGHPVVATLACCRGA